MKIKTRKSRLTEKENKRSRYIGFSPPRCSQRRVNIRDLTHYNQHHNITTTPEQPYLSPIKSKQTHPQSMNIPKHLIDRNIIRDNPADPRKVTKRLEEVPRERIPECGS